MLAVAKTEDEKDFLHFLLSTGFRDDEVAPAQYGDIDFRKGSINVYAKTDYDWTPKNNKSREQDIDLTPKARMKTRKERHGAKSSDLIFRFKFQMIPCAEPAGSSTANVEIEG
jgi:integrase